MTSKTALLVIDVQRVYMEPEPMVTSDGDDLVAKCKSLIDKAHVAGIPVLFVQHVSEDQPDDPDLVAVHPGLEPESGTATIQKTFNSAFLQTDLEGTLADLGVESLTVCGLATFGCVNATVLCALCKGYDVTVVKDAHGARDFPDALAGEVIERFHRTWERAGARLVRQEDAVF